MSHFTVVVLVPQSEVPVPGEINFEAGLLEVVERMLAPFDETLEAPKYQRECRCAARAVSREADARALLETGLTWKGLRESWWDKTEEEKALSSWEDHIKPLVDAEARFTAELMVDAKPSEDCDECHGTGFYTSTYNPLSQWDWYQVGGRWDGHFQSKSEDNPEGYDIPTVADNVAFAKDLAAAEYTPFAILSPREEDQEQDHDNWSEKGSMGWWGMVSDEKDDWKSIAHGLLTKYSNHYAVLMDCHI